MNLAKGKMNILVAGASSQENETIKNALSNKAGVTVAANRAALFELLKTHPFDIIFIDLSLGSGVDLLYDIQKTDVFIKVITIADEHSATEALALLQKGACDFMVKPFIEAEIAGACEKALVSEILNNEKAVLQSDISEYRPSTELVCKSEAMAMVMEKIKAAAAENECVLITGEIGTGKELVARSIHSQSSRRDMPFVVISCGVEENSTFERALFGAAPAVRGKAELAAGGTLFFDEINKASPEMQEKIMQLLADKTFARKGSAVKRPLLARILASSCEDLFIEVHSGAFREDLYGRLKTMAIEVPNLKNRARDIGPLARQFVHAEAERRRKTVRGFNGKVLAVFGKYAWPGNIRELKSVCERMVILARENELLDVDRLPQEIYTGAARGRKIPGFSGKLEHVDLLYDVVGAYEADYIRKVLAKFNWNQSHTARVLGIHRNTLLLKLREYNIPMEKKRLPVATAARGTA